MRKDLATSGHSSTRPECSRVSSSLRAEGPIPVLSEHLEAQQLSFEDAFKASVQNAGSYMSQQRMASTGAGMIVLQTENGLAGSALALSGVLIDKLPLDGPVVAMLPEENHVLFAPLNESAALEEMLDTAEQLFAAAAEYRSLRVVSFSEDGLMQDWVPPAAHPLALRFRTAAATTRKLSAQETYSVSSDDSTVSLGQLSTSVRGALAAAWARDTSVVIPADLDRLVLVDTPKSEHPLVEAGRTTVGLRSWTRKT